MPTTKPKTYEQLKKEWYAKLKRSGFKDIEDSQGRLIQYSADFSKAPGHADYNQLKPQTVEDLSLRHREAYQEYYEIAGKFSHSHKFTNACDKAIWKLHAEGMNNVEINAELVSKFTSLNRFKVRTVIRRLRKVMLGGL